VTALLLAAACGGEGQTAQTRPTTQLISVATAPADEWLPRLTPPDLDARINPRMLVYLEIFQINVPAGTVSASEPFWKHVDEQNLDPAVYDLLYKNGMRAGTAPVNDWEWFRGILRAGQTLTKPTSYQGGQEPTSAEIMLKADLPEETVFYFNRRNMFEGRTYDRSQNVLTMEFAPVPRRPGDVRVRLCPMVRSWRSEFVITGDGDQRKISYIRPEFYYDLSLEADIPLGHFLIIGPSPESAWKASLGHAMLVHDGVAGRMEQVILVVPRPFRMDRERP
jgi:hypothetical protein